MTMQVQNFVLVPMADLRYELGEALAPSSLAVASRMEPVENLEFVALLQRRLVAMPVQAPHEAHWHHLEGH